MAQAAVLGKAGKVAVHRGFADGGVCLYNLGIHLLGRGVVVQLGHRFQHKLFLDGVSFFHSGPPCNILN